MAVVFGASAVSTRCFHSARKYELHRVLAVTVLPSSRQYSSETPRVIKSPTTASLKKGTGGRSSFSGTVCTVFGATGFLGRYICNQLGKIGTQLIIPHRSDPYWARHLKLCGDLGQVLFHPFELRDEDSIRESIKYSDVVINCIGRDWETRCYSFNDVHVDGARRIARLCKEMNVERLIHISCLNANPNPKPLLMKDGSKYFKSKWEGECVVKEEFPEAVIVRPSDIYGQEDRSLVNLYTQLMRRHMRAIPLWKKGELTEKQPIWAGDVSKGIAEIVKNPKISGTTYQFVGPQRYKLADLVNWVVRWQRRHAKTWGHRVVDIEKMPIFKLKVDLLQALRTNEPMGQMHWEGLEKEHTTDVILPGLPSLEDLGVQAMPLASRIGWEIRPYKVHAYYVEAIGEYSDPEPPQALPLH